MFGWYVSGQWKGGRMCGIGTKSMANGDSYTGVSRGAHGAASAASDLMRVNARFTY